MRGRHTESVRGPVGPCERHRTALGPKAHGDGLLCGYRGSSLADVAGLEDLPARLSRMADDLPEAACHPVVARPDGNTVVDARVRLMPRHARDAYLRWLP
ncbi:MULTISPECIES: acetate--CoA ligase family protein [unclassified Streptomyces]|uniref:acetate--CoA ligase family protein n=1 Tax=unclassified Streptomyces TaxID=2593676 RepID=UPI002E31AE1D|nr:MULTISPECIES: acetate--CoA ligase family protein [unclassified Streptomyces]